MLRTVVMESTPLQPMRISDLFLKIKSHILLSFDGHKLDESLCKIQRIKESLENRLLASPINSNCKHVGVITIHYDIKL